MVGWETACFPRTHAFHRSGVAKQGGDHSSRNQARLRKDVRGTNRARSPRVTHTGEHARQEVNGDGHALDGASGQNDDVTLSPRQLWLAALKPAGAVDGTKKLPVLPRCGWQPTSATSKMDPVHASGGCTIRAKNSAVKISRTERYLLCGNINIQGVRVVGRLGVVNYIIRQRGMKLCILCILCILTEAQIDGASFFRFDGFFEFSIW